MAESVTLPENTTNQERAGQGMTAEKSPSTPAHPRVPLPGVESGGLGKSTAHFLDDAQQVVKSHQQGSGD